MSGPWGEGKPGDPGYPSKWRAWWLTWCQDLALGVVALIVLAVIAGWL